MKNPSKEPPEIIAKYKDRWRDIAFSSCKTYPTPEEKEALREKARKLFDPIYVPSGKKPPSCIMIFDSTIHCAIAQKELNDSDLDTPVLELEERINKRVKEAIKNKEDLIFEGLPSFQGRLNAEWFAYLDWYMNENDPYEHLNQEEINGVLARMEITRTFLFWAPFENTIMCVLPPSEVNLGPRGEWHNPNGWAFAFAGGDIGFVSIEGHIFPRHVGFEPHKITIDEIRKENNAEKRRILREKMGDEVYLEKIKAKTIHVDTIPVARHKQKGHIIMRALVEDEFRDRYLVANDGSTGRVYVMLVDSETKTCAEAHESMCLHIPGFKDDNVGLNA